MAERETYTVYHVMDVDQTDPLGTIEAEDGMYVGGTYKGVEDRIGPWAVEKGLTMDAVHNVLLAYVLEPVKRGRRVAKRHDDPDDEVELPSTSGN